MPTDPQIPSINKAYNAYLNPAEQAANFIFKQINCESRIYHHKFENIGNVEYLYTYSSLVTNWTRYLLYKNWIVLIITLIWITRAPLITRIISSIIFFCIHFLSVIGGLFILGYLAPAIFEIKQRYTLSPSLFGTIFMYIFLSVWLVRYKDEVILFFRRIKIDVQVSRGILNEILIILFLFLILRSFIIAFFDFKYYVHFLLGITKMISSVFNFHGYIYGDQLIGDSGALALSKHCLGFLTMFVFAAPVYLTKKVNNKKKWKYIILGLLIIFFLNILRLTGVFIVAQLENGIEKANIHHEVYNVIIYIFVLIGWVIWYERFVNSKRSS